MISRTRTWRIAMLTMVAMAFAMTAGSGVALAASNNHWQGNGDATNWTDGANWELGVSPTVNGSNALLNPLPVSPVTVVIDGTAETANLLSVSGSSAGSVELIIRNGGSLITPGIDTISISGGIGQGTVTVESSASDSTFVKGGHFSIGGQGTAASIINDGFLNLGAGTFEGSHFVIGGFTGDQRKSGIVNLSGTGILSAIGELRIEQNAAFGQTSNVNFDGGGTIKVPLGLQGSIEGSIDAGKILANGAATTFASGLIVKTTDATHAFYNLVPEPTSLALIALGLGGLGGIIRRRRS